MSKGIIIIILQKKYKESLNNIKFIDLFSGIGGFKISFESFGVKCVLSSEIDKYTINKYKNNFNILPSGDIKK